jgi:hypothetical protein
MASNFWRLALAMALATSTVSTTTVASADEPSASDKETARTLMKSGDSKMAAGDHAGALSAYRSADKIMGVPSTRLAVGKAEAAVGLLIEARDTLLSVARIPRASPEPAPFEQARDEAAALAESLAKRIPTLQLEVEGMSPLRVAIDDEEIALDLLAVPRRVNPGEHVVIAEAHGASDRRTITLAEGAVETLTLTLAQPEAPTVPPPAPVPPGPEEAASGGISPVAWIGFGVGAAGVVVGAITGGLALSQANDLKERCPDNRCVRSETETDYDGAHTIAHVSTASFAIGGAGIALGLIGLLVLSDDDSPDEVSLQVGPSSFSLQGRF